MTLLSSERVYSGKVLNLDLDTVQFPDASTGVLEMIRHPGAAAVLPMLDAVDAPDPRVVLIRQFRHAANDFIWEIPAGRLEPNEPPLRCAERELAEETGLMASRFDHLTTILTTPGFTDEAIHLYRASGLSEGEHRREADEFLELHQLAWSTVLDLCRSGGIRDGKTLAAIWFVECHLR